MNNLTLSLLKGLYNPEVSKELTGVNFKWLIKLAASKRFLNTEKKRLPTYAVVRFKNKRRSSKNSCGITALVFDYDGKPNGENKLNALTLIKILEDLGLEFAIVSTFSNETIPPNKFRLLISIDSTVPPEKHLNFCENVVHFLGLKPYFENDEFDSKAFKDKARIYLFGNFKHPDKFFVHHSQGNPINVEQILNLKLPENNKLSPQKNKPKKGNKGRLDPLRANVGIESLYTLVLKKAPSLRIVKPGIARLQCLFNPTHGDDGKLIYTESKLSIGCFHKSCESYTTNHFLKNCSDEEIVDAIKHPTPLPQALLAEPTESEELDKLLEEYAYCVLGSKGILLREIKDQTGKIIDHQFIEKSAFMDIYRNKRLPIIDESGKTKIKTLANLWLESEKRRTYFDIVFEPSLQRIPDTYNLFHGFPIAPKSGDCSLFLSLIRDQICLGDENLYNYTLNFFADLFQNPGRKPGISIVMQGLQGAGKGTFAKTMGKLLGHYFIHISERRHFLGNFNAHLATSLLLFVDEALWPGDKAAEGVLKAMITEETRILEKKGKDAIQVTNHTRIIMATNEHWAIPADLDDRRFLVIKTAPKPEDPDFFKRIYSQLENGGYEALLDILLKRGIANVDLRIRPKTNALLDQKIESFDAIHSYWFSLLNDPYHRIWGEPISTDYFHREFIDHCKSIPTRSLTKAQLGKRLQKIAPGLKKSRLSHDSGDRYLAYVFPNLTRCRDHFEGLVGQCIQWEDPEE
jgi:hypothetical protein